MVPLFAGSLETGAAAAQARQPLLAPPIEVALGAEQGAKTARGGHPGDHALLGRLRAVLNPLLRRRHLSPFHIDEARQGNP